MCRKDERRSCFGSFRVLRLLDSQWVAGQPGNAKLVAAYCGAVLLPGMRDDDPPPVTSGRCRWGKRTTRRPSTAKTGFASFVNNLPGGNLVSHIVQIQSEVRDAAALHAACRRLRLGVGPVPGCPVRRDLPSQRFRRVWQARPQAPAEPLRQLIDDVSLRQPPPRGHALCA